MNAVTKVVLLSTLIVIMQAHAQEAKPPLIEEARDILLGAKQTGVQTEEMQAEPVMQEQAETPQTINEEVIVSPVPQSTGADYPITLNVNNSDLSIVLNTLAELRPDTSIVVDPGVEGSVSINIKKVPWEKALELILKPRGYAFSVEGSNIYRIHKASQFGDEPLDDLSDEGESVNENLYVQLLSQEDKDELDTEETRELLGYRASDAPMTPEQIKDEMMTTKKQFIKKLRVIDQPTVDVLHVLAKKGDLNYSISQQEAIIPALKEGETPPQFQDVNISLSVKMLSLEQVLKMVASRGGYSCVLRNGMWEISPNISVQAKPLVIEQMEVEFLPIGNELINSLKSSLSTRGSIIPGMSKMIIVKDVEDGIEQVRNTLQRMDRPTPQVLIEARFFELTDNGTKDFGIDWNEALGPQNGISIATTSLTARKDGNITPEYDLTTSNPDAATAILKVGQLSTVLRALKNNSTAKQLSNPKVIVTSDQQAKIHIGRQEPIITGTYDAESDTISYELDPAFGGANQEPINLLGAGREMPANATKSIKGYLDLGTIVTVAPSVKTDEDVYIKIIPELISRVSEVSLAEGLFVYPVLTKTMVYTEFTLKSAQTVAIGGLVKEEESTSIDKIPILGDIPYIGKLFTYESSSTVRSEIIIFITVKIIASDSLRAKSGVPVNSRLVEPVLNQIRSQDKLGAEYMKQENNKKEETIEDYIPKWMKDVSDSISTQEIDTSAE